MNKFINKNCFDPVLKNIQEGETVIIPVPDFGRIAFRQQYASWINEILENKKTCKNKTFVV